MYYTWFSAYFCPVCVSLIANIVYVHVATAGLLMDWTPAPWPPWQHPKPCHHRACCLWVCEVCPHHINPYWNSYPPNTMWEQRGHLKDHYSVCVSEREREKGRVMCVCLPVWDCAFFERDVWKRGLTLQWTCLQFAALNASVSRCTVMCAYVPTTYLHVPKAVLYCACMNVIANALLSRCPLWSGTVIFSVPLCKLLSLTKGPYQTTASS